MPRRSRKRDPLDAVIGVTVGLLLAKSAGAMVAAERRAWGEAWWTAHDLRPPHVVEAMALGLSELFADAEPSQTIASPQTIERA